MQNGDIEPFKNWGAEERIRVQFLLVSRNMMVGCLSIISIKYQTSGELNVERFKRDFACGSV